MNGSFTEASPAGTSGYFVPSLSNGDTPFASRAEVLFAQDCYANKAPRHLTTQSGSDHTLVDILMGLAPLEPAERVIIEVRQFAGEAAV